MIGWPAALEGNLLVVAAALLLGLALVLLWLIIRLAGQSRVPPDLETTSTEEAIDLTTTRSHSGLSRMFRHAARSMRRASPGGGGPGRSPRILMLAPARPGPTLLAESDVAAPFGRPEQPTPPDDPGVNWWAVSGGVVLEVVQEDVLRADGSAADQQAWRSALVQIRKSRPRRPLDGVVLTIPADTLVGTQQPERLQAEAARRGTLLSRTLSDLQRITGMRVPVYLLVSDCDVIDGFPAVVAAAAGRQQMLGWSNPHPAATPYSGGLVDQGFATVFEEVEGFGLRALAAATTESTPSAEWLLFLSRFRDLQAPLRVFANHLFGGTLRSNPPPFRGFYFCGRAATSTSASPSTAFFGDLIPDKAFPEASLADPTDDASRRARRKTGALAAVTVAALLWLGLGLRVGGPRLEHTVAGMADFLAGIAGQRAPALDQTKSNQFLTDAQAVGDFELRSIAFPGAWLSRLVSNLDGAVEAGFTRNVFDTIGEQLATRTEALVTSGRRSERADSAAADATAVLAIEDYPSYTALNDFSQQLERLDYLIGIHQRFSTDTGGTPATTVAEFNRLSSAVLTGGMLEPRDTTLPYLGRRLNAVRAVPFSHTQNDFSDRLENTSRVLTTNFIDAIFRDNPLATDVRQIRNAWIDGPPSANPSPSEIDRYGRLRDALRNTQAHVQSADLAWTAASVLDLGPGFDAIRRRIYDSPFLGREVSDAVSNSAVKRFQALREVLETTEAGASGRILLRGEEQWALSPKILTVLAALDSLLGEPFMRDWCTPATVSQLTSTSSLSWRAQPLEDALNLYDAYQDWYASNQARGETTELPAPLQGTVPGATRGGVAKNVVCLIASAQSIVAAPVTDSPRLLERHIDSQVQNLGTVTDSLNRLIPALGQLELDAEQTNLTQALQAQQTQILTHLQTLLDGQRLYTPTALNDWREGTDSAETAVVTAFGATDVPGLGAYLETQRAILQEYAERYAQPAIDSIRLPTSGAPSLVGSWRNIITQLALYKADSPGNNLAALEQFIAVEMPQVTLDTCPSPTVRAAGDFFALRESRLRSALGADCAATRATRYESGWHAIADAFGGQLAGRFPFTAETIAPTEEATFLEPAALRDFYGMYDQRVGDVRRVVGPAGSSPDGTRSAGPEVAARRGFLDTMGALRAVLAPFLDAEDPRTQPTLIFEPEFRVAPPVGSPAGTSHDIAAWQLSTGRALTKRVVTDLDVQAAIEWAWNDPISLTLRWAKDGPTVPLAGSCATPPTPDAGTVMTADGVSSVAFSSAQPWALISFLRSHLSRPTATTASTRPASSAETDAAEPLTTPPTPHANGATGTTLGFAIATRASLFKRGDQSQCTHAYLRLTVIDPTTRRPLALPLMWPARAPSAGDTR